MSLKISNDSLLARHYLIVDSSGVQFTDNSALGTKRLEFEKIECVLMSPDHKLSFQYGNEVFSIPVKSDNPSHQAVIDALLQEVRRTAGAAIQG
jgi:hypothetical protein